MRLKEKYDKKIAPQLKEKFGYKNIFMAPKLEKAVVNVGFGRFNKDSAYIDNIKNNLADITGQKCVLTKAKKAISAFKIREGMVIGAKVTLRGARMYDFVEKLVNVTLPRVRDFRGLAEKSIDKTGNLTIGFKEHLAFPEVSHDSVENIHGLEVIISTTAKNKEESLELLKLLGFPLKREEADIKETK
ncbi:MAG: 50S ribosomal protein L5 [Patescibacteria group bacterium]|nr:50S ribosomal protein L5 [Patescibacteria group bacterium]